jgi:hypothetical protein|tara:strand:- start:127 stop:630 length:504 start_codon:yes stop_codon:yes gene_type:complete
MKKIKQIFEEIDFYNRDNISLIHTYCDVYNISIFKKWLNSNEFEMHMKPLLLNLHKNKKIDAFKFQAQAFKFYSFYEEIFNKFSIFLINENKSHEEINKSNDFFNLIRASLEKEKHFEFYILELDIIFMTGYDFTDSFYALKGNKVDDVFKLIELSNLFILPPISMD